MPPQILDESFEDFDEAMMDENVQANLNQEERKDDQ